MKRTKKTSVLETDGTLTESPWVRLNSFGPIPEKDYCAMIPNKGGGLLKEEAIMTARRALLRFASSEEKRYSIIPIPEDVDLTKKMSENINGLINKMTPSQGSHCRLHPNRNIAHNCISCGNHPICDECYAEKHDGHNIEDINARIKVLLDRLETVKRNMDKINERCLILSDENQNEESQVKTLFDNMQLQFQNKQEAIKKRLQLEEADLVKYEQSELRTINYSKDADMRLYEVEAIEAVSAIDMKIEALENEKLKKQAEIDAKLEERKQTAVKQIEQLQMELAVKRVGLREERDKLVTNEEIFQKVYSELKSVGESHANFCREIISSFLKNYQDIAPKVDAIDNGSKTSELLQVLSNLIEGTEANTNSVSNDSFVLEIPQVHYQKQGDSNEVGHFLLYTGEEKPCQFTWGRSSQKGWYIENLSGLSKQLIAVVSRKRGSKETYLDIIMHNGDQLTTHKITTRNADAYHFVCAVSPYSVATCCEGDVNLMNIDNGTVEVTHKLNKCEEAWNITYNKTRREIMVGILGTNELRVFDETLTPLRTVIMENTNRAPLSLAASGDNVFVCTYENRAFVLDGNKGTVKTTFHRNGMENRAWRICCDSLDMVYVMWLRASGVIRVTRYTLKGEPLSSLDADCNVRFLSFALIQNGAEQLIVATEEGEFSLHRTPSKVEDAMVKAVDKIGMSKTLRVMSVWKPL